MQKDENKNKQFSIPKHNRQFFGLINQFHCHVVFLLLVKIHLLFLDVIHVG